MNQISKHLLAIWEKMAWLVELKQSIFLLVLRLYWGWQFFMAGTGKFSHMDKVVGYFTNLGIPLPQANALLVATTETMGGCLLIAGLASRLISIPLTITMIVAYLTAESAKLQKIFSDPTAFVSAVPCTFLLVCLVIAHFGPGKISLDYLILKKVKNG